MVKSMIISFSRKKYILQWIKVDFYLHMLLPIVFRIKISISRSHLEKCQKLESEKNIANQFISNMRVFLIHYHYIWFEMPLLGSAWTRMGPTTSCPQIPSAIIGVIGVFGSGVGYLLPGKGIKESLHWKEFFSPNPRFLFLPMPTEITAWGYFPLHQPPPPVKEIALTSSIYCFHMRAVISLANGNETQNCNKWGHATECRCSLLLAQSTHARSN